MENNLTMDSPSNKINNLKILTFGINCNFPDHDVKEIEDEEESYEENLCEKIKLEKSKI
jgi:hypothetical protein